MTEDTLLPFDLPAVRRKKLTVDFEGGNQSSDAGLLLLREAERKLGVCRRLAEAMPDDRDQDRVRHEMFELVMERTAAIACGHEDGNDLDRLRQHFEVELCYINRGCRQFKCPRHLRVQFTKVAALELAQHNIRVNALCPGYFQTELNGEWFKTPEGQALIKRIPQRRTGKLEELNGPLLLLASDAGSLMTGAAITVDGGHVLSDL